MLDELHVFDVAQQFLGLKNWHASATGECLTPTAHASVFFVFVVVFSFCFVCCCFVFEVGAI